MKKETKDYVSNKGILTSETSMEDEDFGFCFIDTPNDIEKVEFFTENLRLRESELNGKICTYPPDEKGYSGEDYLTEVELLECDFVYHQLKVNPKEFNVPGYKEVIDVLVNITKLFHEKEVDAGTKMTAIKEGISLGNKYLSDRGVKINGLINRTYLIDNPQPLTEQEKSDAFYLNYPRK